MGPNVKKCAFWAILFIFGGPWGPLRRAQGYQIFRAVRRHHRADTFITRKTNNHQYFIYQTGPILLSRHPLTYINLHIKYGSNPIRIFLSYRENDEVSADADAAA